jgi:endonuclease/exonuclease/phosphatase family metal-dependent hydrolase
MIFPEVMGGFAMRIATYNVESLFQRVRAMNDSVFLGEGASSANRWANGKATLEAYARFNALVAKKRYAAADKRTMLTLLDSLGIKGKDDGTLALLRRNRGEFLYRPRGGDPEIIASGRDDWIGWLELKKEAVDEEATRNTARVIRDVGADILVTVEAEDRPSLVRFNADLIGAVGGTAHDQIMLIDGNDERGIDVGLMVNEGIDIDHVRSHVNDRQGGRQIFSRDCPEYHLVLGNGQSLVVLANHFKSKGFGKPAESNARRKAQAQRVRDIYEGLRAQGQKFVAIAGDLNDTPDSDPLRPLLGQGSDLKDISDHPRFDDGGRPGTYGNCTAGNKIDYLLLSPALFAKVKAGGINRTGVWGGTNGTLWPMLPELTTRSHAASDHAALWADVDL